MNAKILIVFLITLIVVACSKTGFSNNPQLSLQNVSSTSLHQGDVLTFNIQFTDKNGTALDTMWIQRVSKICPADVSSIIYYPIPAFTATSYLKGTFSVSYIYNVVNGPYPFIGTCSTPKNDTSYFKIWINDAAGHKSDTITSPNIAFLK
jgi:hypothetical protein